jgi:hypothetical protein
MSREAFEKWWKETYHDVPRSIWDNEHLHNLAIHAWQACEAEQSKRIAELEAENVEFQKRITKDVFKIKKLQSQNKELVWALEHVKPATRNIDANAWDVIEKALAKVA